MPSFDDQPLSEKLSGVVGNTLGAVFLIGFTAFSGFCFVFGILFSLFVAVMTIRAWLIGVPQSGNPWAFIGIMVSTMIAYEYVSWRFFRFGWSLLRGDPRQGDPFDADGRPK